MPTPELLDGQWTIRVGQLFAQVSGQLPPIELLFLANFAKFGRHFNRRCHLTDLCQKATHPRQKRAEFRTSMVTPDRVVQ
jgi:hypothetical protein